MHNWHWFWLHCDTTCTVSLNHGIMAVFTLLKWTWNSIPMPQTLYTCLIWMYEVVWGGCQPRPWSCGIIFTPQVNLNPQIWGQLGQRNGIMVQPYAIETAYQCLKHFVCDEYGCMKWLVVDVSLNHDVMALFPLLKWTWIPKTRENLARVMV